MNKKWATGPYLLWTAIFTIVPVLMVIYFAFSTSGDHFTLDNITGSGQYSGVFLKSIWLGFIATVICLVLGYAVAYGITKISKRYQAMLILLIMLPMWMNFLLRTYAWMTLLEDNGLINRFLGIFHIGPFQMINTSGAVVLGMVYNYLPFMVMPIYTVLSKMNRSLIEAAQDLGSSGWEVFKRVTLPLSIPGVVSGITMVFVPAVSTFIISRMLGGGANLLIGDLIEMQFVGSAYNPHLGAAISLVLMVFVLICMGIMNELDDGETEAAHI